MRYGSENLWLAIEEYRNQNIVAIRYEKKETDGSIWDTDYVMNFSSMRMSIRLDRSYTREALAAKQRFSTPHFITLLIERGYLKDDSGLPVLRTPITIDRSNLNLLSEIIKRLLRNYNGMNGRLRQDLIDLGFEITDEGKHYKITYFGDGRYQTTFARTPSDGRSGKNNALVVVRMAF